VNARQARSPAWSQRSPCSADCTTTTAPRHDDGGWAKEPGQRFAPVAAPVTGESLRPTRYAGPRPPALCPENEFFVITGYFRSCYYAEGDEAGPRAPAHALLGVVAAPAVAPEVARRAVARVAERLAPLPDVLERRVADVSARPRRGRQRGAALDGAVRLDAERRAPGVARTAKLGPSGTGGDSPIPTVSASTVRKMLAYTSRTTHFDPPARMTAAMRSIPSPTTSV
jgi:hypothetical protein